jgi:hypothetical protein
LAELVLDALEPAVEVIDAADHGLALRRQPGNDYELSRNCRFGVVKLRLPMPACYLYYCTIAAAPALWLAVGSPWAQ